VKGRTLSLTFAIIALGASNLLAGPITSLADPLVKELEARYSAFVNAVHRGDIKTFRTLRTAEANKGIPPEATGEQLKTMADMMAPPIKGFTFLQLETVKNAARLVYKNQTKEGLSILVLMFEKEGGAWMVGGNHTQDFVGQVPKDAAALKEALSSPEVQLPK
jgi:hypothetical protein